MVASSSHRCTENSTHNIIRLTSNIKTASKSCIVIELNFRSIPSETIWYLASFNGRGIAHSAWHTVAPHSSNRRQNALRVMYVAENWSEGQITSWEHLTPSCQNSIDYYKNTSLGMNRPLCTWPTRSTSARAMWNLTSGEWQWQNWQGQDTIFRHFTPYYHVDIQQPPM